jgi:predicted ribosome quality control (RQC) complex YloA/Tae2 family protein
MSTETLAEQTEATEAETREFAGHMDKEPTHLHRGYAVYLKEKVGYGPEAPAEGEAPSDEWKHFVKTIQLAVVLYGKYQKSPENAARKVDEAQERDAKLEEAKEAKAKAAEAKKAEKEAAKAKADEEAAAEGTEAVPGKKAAKPKAAKPKPASTVEAPF